MAMTPDLMKPHNSILARPIRSPSLKNMESNHLQEQRDDKSNQRRVARYETGNVNTRTSYHYNCWADVDTSNVTAVDYQHGQYQSASPNNQFNGSSGKRHGSRREHVEPGPSVPRPGSYDIITNRWEICGDNGPRNIKRYELETGQRTLKRVHYNSKSDSDGVYNPLTHTWVVPPTDPRCLDREKGWRSSQLNELAR